MLLSKWKGKPQAGRAYLQKRFDQEFIQNTQSLNLSNKKIICFVLFYVVLYMCVGGTRGGQERSFDVLGLELLAGVSDQMLTMGTKLRSSVRGTSTLNFWSISEAPKWAKEFNRSLKDMQYKHGKHAQNKVHTWFIIMEYKLILRWNSTTYLLE